MCLSVQQDGAEKPPVKERPVNMNIRKPIIPGRSAPGESAPDTNPLRRLRDSQHFTRPTAVPPRPPSGGGLVDSTDTTPKPNGVISPSGLPKTQPDISNPKPLPPRVPLKPSTINLKPRERKHPLEISDPIPVLPDSVHKQPTVREVIERFSAGPPTTYVKTHSQSSAGSDLNTTRDSEDSVFTSSSEADTGRKPAVAVTAELNRRFPGIFTAQSQFSVKMVDTSAEEMGLNNTEDSFWTEKVSEMFELVDEHRKKLFCDA